MNKIINTASNQEYAALISAIPDITQHTFLDKSNIQEKENYLKALSLCFTHSAEINTNGKDFINRLINKSDMVISLEKIKSLIDETEQFNTNMPLFADFIKTENDKYTLLLDLLFLSHLCEINIENKRMLSIIETLKPANFRNNFKFINTLLFSNNKNEIIQAISHLMKITDGWKNIILYRELEFESCFWELSLAINRDYINVVSMQCDPYFFRLYPEFLSDQENYITRKISHWLKNSAVSDLNKKRREIWNFINNKKENLNKLNSFMNSFSLPAFHIEHLVSDTDYQLDTSDLNDNLGEQIFTYKEQLLHALDQLCDNYENMLAQIRLFEQGKFDQHIIELQIQQKREKEKQQQLEWERKRTAELTMNNKQYSLRIQWKTLNNLPFLAENISQIVSDNKTWVVFDRKNERLFKSECGEHWEQVDIPKETVEYIRNIAYIDDTWIIFIENDKFIYSNDMIHWEQGSRPAVIDDDRFRLNGMPIKYKNQWLWKISQSKEYEYIEKGLVWDSYNKCTYHKSIIYVSDALNGCWEIWEHSPYIPEGIELEELVVCSDNSQIMALFRQDFAYRINKKELEIKPYIKYLSPNNQWNKCTWEQDLGLVERLNLISLNNKIYCMNSNGILIPNDNFEWNVILKDIKMTRIEDILKIDDFILLKSRKLAGLSGNYLYFIHNETDYAKLSLDNNGIWQNMSGKGNRILSIFSPSQHKIELRLGEIILEEKTI